jgi:hypothetical protein
MSKTQQTALRISAVLWIVWGLVHMLAGALTMSLETAGAVAGIADAVDPAVLVADYHGAVGAVINQHGFNLLWIGLFTVIGAVFIWRGSYAAAFLTGVVGGLADIGYFLFLDLGGYVNFVPGTIMTLISSLAIILSLASYAKGRMEGQQ